MNALRKLLRTRLGWLMPVLCLLLATTWTWMYVRTPSRDASVYFEDIALLRQLKQLDAHLELDAMKSKIGLNHSYDALVDPLRELGALPQQLRTLTAAGDGRSAVRLNASVAAYQRELRAKAALVEAFKSHNAVLSNSLGFLPTAVDDIEALALHQGVPPSLRAQSAAMAANRVLTATLVYSQLPSDTEAQEVGGELAGLAAASHALDAALQERIDLFTAHVNTVLREQDIVQHLLAGIASANTAARIDDIGAILVIEQEQAVQRLQTYRLYLSLLAVTLVGLLAALALRLIRSHATINRVNAQLQHANDHLERRVAMRTGELEQANTRLHSEMAERKQLESRLVQSEKLASIGQLAAGVAHEINNPLAFLASNFGMLESYLGRLFEMLDAYQAAESGIAPAPVRTWLTDTRERLDMDFLRQDIPQLLGESRGGMERVGKIVQDLKDFSHAGSEQKWERADLLPGLKSTLNIIAKQLRQVAEVETDYGAMPEIDCLPSQLNQVFMNLMINAAHAIGPERGRITIRTGGDRDAAWVEVSDTGCGIPDHVLPRIFDPFYTTKPIGKGTGLGLSLSYGIVQKHHGRIDVVTELGAGSTFRVTLPASRELAAA